MGCLFILSTVSLNVWKSAYCSLICLLCFWCHIQTITAHINVMGLSLSMCSTNSFIDFALLLEYLIHFEMIIMYGERNRPILIFFVLNIQISQYHSLKRYFRGRFLLKISWILKSFEFGTLITQRLGS